MRQRRAINGFPGSRHFQSAFTDDFTRCLAFIRKHGVVVRLVGAAILAASAVVSVACASKTISQVLADPSRYRNRHVRLSGSVVDSYALANRWTYRIDDDTGQLWVVSDLGTPRMGARVTNQRDDS